MSDLFHEAARDEWIDRTFAVMALTPQHTFLVLTKRAARMRDYVTSRPRDTVYPDMAVILTESGSSHYRFLWPLPNVWLGVSVEDQVRADERIPELLATPAAVRWISAEPLLEPVNLQYLGNRIERPIDSLFGRSGSRDRYPDGGRGSIRWTPAGSEPHLDWVICGGESGPGARPMHAGWARSLRDQCVAAEIPFFFKQWGEFAPVDSATDGGDTRETMVRVGKLAAGRLLDGRIWDEIPN